MYRSTNCGLLLLTSTKSQVIPFLRLTKPFAKMLLLEQRLNTADGNFLFEKIDRSSTSLSGLSSDSTVCEMQIHGYDQECGHNRFVGFYLCISKWRTLLEEEEPSRSFLFKLIWTDPPGFNPLYKMHWHKVCNCNKVNWMKLGTGNGLVNIQLHASLMRANHLNFVFSFWKVLPVFMKHAAWPHSFNRLVLFRHVSFYLSYL